MSRIAEIVAQASDIEHEDMVIPQWGNVTLRIVSMDLAARGAYLEKLIKAREEGDDVEYAQLQAELLVRCATDPDDGSKAFALTDVPMLLTKHGAVVNRIANKATILSGLDADAEERLGKPLPVSAVIPSDDSSSTSPTVSE